MKTEETLRIDKGKRSIMKLTKQFANLNNKYSPKSKTNCVYLNFSDKFFDSLQIWLLYRGILDLVSKGIQFVNQGHLSLSKVLPKAGQLSQVHFFFLSSA